MTQHESKGEDNNTAATSPAD